MFKSVSGVVAGFGLVLQGAAPCGYAEVPSQDSRVSGVEIRRTTDGIPHIRAHNWSDLGFGYGYVQAQDALCTLAEGFVTYEGRRSYYFGSDERPSRDSTFGQAKNLELDLFFRALVDSRIVEEMRRRQPDGLNDLIAGFVAGYNRYLRETRQRESGPGRPACLREAWVREISSDDIYRRAYAAGLAAGYARFVTEIANAQPPTASPASSAGSTLHNRLQYSVGNSSGLGSNAIAFGADATRDGAAVLYGNPHWYWGGPDRFYQAHLTIPGVVNVAGVSFLGVPVIVIGFNEQVAWSHTVSAARRFGLFELQLDPQKPTVYWLDGAREPMREVPITIAVRGDDVHSSHKVHRTLYQTRFGPIVDLSAQAPPFGWGAQRALALRDINAGNFRVFTTFFRWSQARSLDEFVAIQRGEGAIPWVNTIAIARNERRVWYADIGAVPNVSNELRVSCAAALSAPFASVDPAAPLLDGSRSACQWPLDPQAPLAGAMPVALLPGLFSTGHVANMNNSYWLSDPRHPLEGFAAVLGGEREPLSLRARYGYLLAAALQGNGGLSSRTLSRRLRDQALSARAYPAELFKKDLLNEACASGAITVSSDALTGKAFDPPRSVNVVQACRVLRRWSNTGNSTDRGSLLWDELWRRVALIPATELFQNPFSPEAPLRTPASIAADNPRVAQSLAAAVLAMSERSRPLDAPRGRYLYANSAGHRVPLFGGCEDIGYFAMACNTDGQYTMSQNSIGNSYLQVVRFTDSGVEAFTLLAHGEHESTLTNSASAAESLLRYARKDWLRLPFREEEIARDPGLTREVLRPEDRGGR